MNKNNSLISSLLAYIKKPDYNIAVVDQPFLKKLSDIIKYWSLGIVLAFLAAILSAAFLNNIGVDDSQNILQDFFANSSIYTVVLIVFFIGPINEELTFRLGLRYSPFKFSYAFTFLLFLFLESLMASNVRFEQVIDAMVNALGIFYFLALLLFGLATVGFLLGLLISKTILSKKIEKFYQNNFPFIFYSLTILFAAIHFFNFANSKDLLLVLPFLVAPQLFLGFILAFIRMRYSILWSIFYHFFHNALAALPILLFAQISDEGFDIILNGNNKEIQNIAINDQTFLLAGTIISLFVFIIVIVFFFLLIKDYRRFKSVRSN